MIAVNQISQIQIHRPVEIESVEFDEDGNAVADDFEVEGGDEKRRSKSHKKYSYTHYLKKTFKTAFG